MQIENSRVRADPLLLFIISQLCTYHMDSQALDSRKRNTTNTVVQYNRKFQHQTIFGRESQQKFRSNVWRMIVVLYL